MEENESIRKQSILNYPINDIVELVTEGLDRETGEKICRYWSNTYWKALKQIKPKLSAYPDPESIKKLTPDEAFKLFVLFKLCFIGGILDHLDFLVKRVIQIEKKMQMLCEDSHKKKTKEDIKHRKDEL